MPTSERAPMRERGIPDGYRPVDGSERRPAPGAVQCGPADPHERLSVIILVRARPGSAELPDVDAWEATLPN
ncbi:MAG: hypothetical protein ACLPYS_12825 [Vulcanimicrobiaceae bacterium]